MRHIKIKIFSSLPVFFLILSFSIPALSNPNDYHLETGEPKCMSCHTSDRKYSIDYTRQESCAECHGSGLSDQYLSMNERHRYVTDSAAPQPMVVAKLKQEPVKKAERPASTKDMALIPAGEYTMGSNDWWPKSQPEHIRNLDAFNIDRFEVTNRRYKEFVDATGYHHPKHWTDGIIPPGRIDHPVTFVNWFDADNFCKWEGKRLPTEAEWEKAARGTDKRTFPWGDEFAKEKGNTPQYGHGDTMVVGSFPQGKSPYGVHDLAGNVFEWLNDWFQPYPGNNHPDENYGELYRIVRGGSWYDCTYYKCGISAPAYNRIFFNPYTLNNNFGFRCAKDEVK